MATSNNQTAKNKRHDSEEKYNKDRKPPFSIWLYKLHMKDTLE